MSGAGVGRALSLARRTKAWPARQWSSVESVVAAWAHSYICLRASSSPTHLASIIIIEHCWWTLHTHLIVLPHMWLKRQTERPLRVRQRSNGKWPLSGKRAISKRDNISRSGSGTT
eukprot:12973423-Alexandrium_andersonii.AAC.1